MSHPLRQRVIAGATVLAAGLSLLAGCGDDAKIVVNSDDGTVSVDDGKVTVETDEGTATVGQGLPEGFPEDEIPLLGEKVVTGVQGQPDGSFAWSVTMQSSRAVDDLEAEVKEDFADAGYTEAEAVTMGDASIMRFNNDTYEVGVTIARSGSSVGINYVVTEAG